MLKFTENSNFFFNITLCFQIEKLFKKIEQFGAVKFFTENLLQLKFIKKFIFVTFDADISGYR
jgi:hypothetical protein